ncbi:DUF5134 domain-containing protein, partial [Streptomyces sp. GC420]|uniref:DUF5134 domain-containing protein n=1 Tax=Streptomyces sp. GC420 TaxID=2697568 RepID=UPI0014150374
MHGPAMAGWLLVGVCAATGSYCLLRMRAGDRGQRAQARGEALMGFAMAAMAVPTAVLSPPPWAWIPYAVVFGATAVREAWLVRGGGHHLHHLVGSLAMVYMAVAMAAGAPGAHSGHGGSGVPLMTGALLAYYAVFVLRSGSQLLPAGTAAATVRSGPG